MSLLTLIAFGLLGLGVVGSLHPRFPGTMASLAGVYLYWWSTGFTEPSVGLVVVLTVFGVLAIFSTLFEEVLAARISGASRGSATAAGAVGIVAFVFVGPIAMLLATLLTVFVLEYRRHHDLKASLVATTGVLFAAVATRILKLILATVILIIMLAVLIL